MTQLQANLSRARALLDAMNRHDAPAVAALYAANATTIGAGGFEAEGRQAVEASYRSQFQSFPDMTLQVLKVVAPAPNTLISEYTLSGTHLGPLKFGDQEVAPTGRYFAVQYCITLQFNDAGEIISSHSVGNPAAMLRQLGIIRAPHVTSEDAMATVRKLIEAENRKDFAAVGECISEEAVFGSPLLGEVRGRTAIVKSLEQTLNTYHNAAFTLKSITADDNVVVAVVQIQATNTGDFSWGGKATGKEINFESTWVCEVGPNGVFRAREYYNAFEIMRQMGWVRT